MPRIHYYQHKGHSFFRIMRPHIQKYFPYHTPEISGVGPIKATLSGKVPKPPFSLALGQVMPFEKVEPDLENIVQVKLHKLCLNKFLLKFYYQTATFWADHKGHATNPGDIVLLKHCNPPIAFNTVFQVEKVVFPVGGIIDPVTGLPCHGTTYSEATLADWMEKVNISSKSVSTDEEAELA